MTVKVCLAICSETEQLIRDGAKSDGQALYAQAAAACCHYSTVLSTVRMVNVTQALVILGTAGILTKEKEFLYSILVCGFEVLFCLFLTFYRKNYLYHFLAHVALTERIEYAMSGRQKPAERNAFECVGPWNAYSTKRTERHEKRRWGLRLWSLFMDYGPLVVFTIGIVVLLAADLYGGLKFGWIKNGQVEKQEKTIGFAGETESRVSAVRPAGEEESIAAKANGCGQPARASLRLAGGKESPPVTSSTPRPTARPPGTPGLGPGSRRVSAGYG
jgi:hypothetical protein